MLSHLDYIQPGEDKTRTSLFYYLIRNRQLNPVDFLHDDDELFIITGRDEKYADITKHWAEKYFPMAKLIILGQDEPELDTDINDWLTKQAKIKSRALKKYKIDVYFEDTPEIVKRLRELCSDIAIIQYGGRMSG